MHCLHAWFGLSAFCSDKCDICFVIPALLSCPRWHGYPVLPLCRIPTQVKDELQDMQVTGGQIQFRALPTQYLSSSRGLGMAVRVVFTRLLRPQAPDPVQLLHAVSGVQLTFQWACRHV